MKRIICLITLILFFSLVFAEDYSVNKGINNNVLLTDSSNGNIETARLRSDIAVLNNKIDSQNKVISELLKASDVNQYKDEFFNQSYKIINKFMADLLVMTFAFYIFIFASLFLMKAKRLL